MTEPRTAIKTRQLSKNFNTLKAVDGLDIEIRKGEIFSLLGTNGAGKTTTIKMLCCILKPASGSAEVMGHDIESHPMEIKKIIGVSPQETAITGHLNPRENLVLMGGIFGLPKKQNKQRADEMLELMELTDRRKSQSRKLSGGMQRRLSLAMALMSDPEILFLDEPTLGLDPHARRTMWNYIEKLKGKKTIFLTTHYLEEADALADHIAIMKEGRIIDSGTSRDLKRKYRKKQTLLVTARELLPGVVDNLRKQKLEVVQTGNSLIVEAPELDFYTIVDFLKASKVVIEGIELKEPSLDDVFIELTGKEVAP